MGLTPDSEPGAVKASSAGAGTMTPAFPERPFTPIRVMTPCPGLGCSIRRAARQRAAPGTRIRTLLRGDASVTGVHRKQRRRAYADRPPALKGSRCQTTISCSFKLSSTPPCHIANSSRRMSTGRSRRRPRWFWPRWPDSIRRCSPPAHSVAHEKALPFAPLLPNAPTIAAMKEARAGSLPQFEDVQSLLDDLHAND